MKSTTQSSRLIPGLSGHLSHRCYIERRRRVGQMGSHGPQWTTREEVQCRWSVGRIGMRSTRQPCVDRPFIAVRGAYIRSRRAELPELREPSLCSSDTVRLGIRYVLCRRVRRRQREGSRPDGKARRGKARQGKQCKARQGKTSQDRLRDGTV